jgi:ribosomal protein L11 methyltransferase
MKSTKDDTLELKITLDPPSPWSDIIIAELSECGFDSFVTHDNGISAYATGNIDLEKAVKKSLEGKPDEVSISYEKKLIPHQNWNEKWESEFEPVIIEDYASIIAPFHDEGMVSGMPIIVKPEMSFGTGHHQTTWMMMKALFELPNIRERVLDMGTGTGVLAIAAEKLGAQEILAVDIEDWSIENTKENAIRNGCTRISAVHGDLDIIGGRKFGLILANINKNTLLKHIEKYAESLENQGTLLLSGFFVNDCKELVNYAENFNLLRLKEFEKEGWSALQFVKQTH